MDELLATRLWKTAVELPMNDETLIGEWPSWGSQSMYIAGDDGVPGDISVSEHAGAELVFIDPSSWYPCYILPLNWMGYYVGAEHDDTFGSLEPVAVSEMVQQKGPFRRIVSDEKATDQTGVGYVLECIRECRTALDNLVRELRSKALLLAKKEATSALHCAYYLCSRLVKQRLNMSFADLWFGLPSRKLRDLSRSASCIMNFSVFKGDLNIENIIIDHTIKHYRAPKNLDLQMQFFAHNLSENTFGCLKSMAPNSGIAETPLDSSPWTHKIVNGPEHRSVPEEGAGIRAAIKEENCGNEGTWLVATAAPHHATGNRELLTGFTPDEDRFLQAGDGTPMEVRGRGAVVTNAVALPDVWFVPGLAENLVSAGQLAELGYTIEFTRGACRIIEGGGSLAGEARVGEDGLFEVQFLKLPLAM